MSSEFMKELEDAVSQHDLDRARAHAERTSLVAKGFESIIRDRLLSEASARGRTWARLSLNDPGDEGGIVYNSADRVAYDALDLARATFAQEGFEAKVEDTPVFSRDLATYTTKALSVWLSKAK